MCIHIVLGNQLDGDEMSQTYKHTKFPVSSTQKKVNTQ